jgi:hypothetical protein
MVKRRNPTINMIGKNAIIGGKEDESIRAYEQVVRLWLASCDVTFGIFAR